MMEITYRGGHNAALKVLVRVCWFSSASSVSERRIVVMHVFLTEGNRVYPHEIL